MANEQAWADVRAFSELLTDIKAKLRRLAEMAEAMGNFKASVFDDVTVTSGELGKEATTVAPNPRKADLKKLLVEHPNLTDTNVKATLARIAALRAKIMSDFSDLL
jgi:hypothetical protein